MKNKQTQLARDVERVWLERAEEYGLYPVKDVKSNEEKKTKSASN